MLAVFFSVLQENQPSHTSYHHSRAISTSALYLHRWPTDCLLSTRLRRTPFTGTRHLLVYTHDMWLRAFDAHTGETSPTSSGHVPFGTFERSSSTSGGEPFRASHTDWRRSSSWLRLLILTHSSSATATRRISHHRDTSDSTDGDTSIPMLRTSTEDTRRTYTEDPCYTDSYIGHHRHRDEILRDFTHLGGAHHHLWWTDTTHHRHTCSDRSTWTFTTSSFTGTTTRSRTFRQSTSDASTTDSRMTLPLFWTLFQSLPTRCGGTSCFSTYLIFRVADYIQSPFASGLYLQRGIPTCGYIGSLLTFDMVHPRPEASRQDLRTGWRSSPTLALRFCQGQIF